MPLLKVADTEDAANTQWLKNKAEMIPRINILRSQFLKIERDVF
jgi:hypothetical protein